jgi:hypothetical protein
MQMEVWRSKKGVEIKLGRGVAEGVSMAVKDEGWRVGVGEGVRDVVVEGEDVRVGVGALVLEKERLGEGEVVKDGRTSHSSPMPFKLESV